MRRDVSLTTASALEMVQPATVCTVIALADLCREEERFQTLMHTRVRQAVSVLDTGKKKNAKNRKAVAAAPGLLPHSVPSVEQETDELEGVYACALRESGRSHSHRVPTLE